MLNLTIPTVDCISMLITTDVLQFSVFSSLRTSVLSWTDLPMANGQEVLDVYSCALVIMMKLVTLEINPM